MQTHLAHDTQHGCLSLIFHPPDSLSSVLCVPLVLLISPSFITLLFTFHYWTFCFYCKLNSLTGYSILALTSLQSLSLSFWLSLAAVHIDNIRILSSTIQFWLCIYVYILDWIKQLLQHFPLTSHTEATEGSSKYQEHPEEKQEGTNQPNAVTSLNPYLDNINKNTTERGSYWKKSLKKLTNAPLGPYYSRSSSGLIKAW